MENDNSYYFNIRLLIRHPFIDPDEVTKSLGLHPKVSGRAGAQRLTPNGLALGGQHPYSVWSFSWQQTGDRRFFLYLSSVLDELVPNTGLFKRIRAEGGETQIIIGLFGQFNIGDTADVDLMKRLSDMKIRLGIEVFPDWHAASQATSFTEHQNDR